MKILRVLAWAYLIIIGALMFTPGGVDCIACGAMLTKVLAVVAIGLGGIGIVNEVRGGTLGI